MSAIVYLDTHGVECQGGATATVPRRGSDDPDYALDRMVIQPGYADRSWLNNKVLALGGGCCIVLCCCVVDFSAVGVVGRVQFF